MSVDPSAVIVGLATALGGVIQGADMPPTLKDYGTQQIQSIKTSAPAFGEQLNEYIEFLPQQAQGPAQLVVGDLANAVQTAVDPYLPSSSEHYPTVEPRAEGIAPGPAPDLDAATRTEDPTSGATVSVEEAVSIEAFSGKFSGGVHPAPETGYLFSPTTAQVGAIAVFVPWFQKAGNICAGIKSPTLAALYSVENGFRYGATAPVSRDGARGPGQFMPGTWVRYGKDADGDGRANILDVGDSVMASGHLLCDMFLEIEGWKEQGVVAGDTLDMAIAGYNAGIGAVRKSGGIPYGLPDYENQTKPYVARIRAIEGQFEWLLSPPNNLPGIGAQIFGQAPTSGLITSIFGDGRGHEGIDIANTIGAPIVSVADGEVINAGPAQGFGLWVRIRHDDGTVTTYGHNNGNLVAVGERVSAGQQIATVGNRGNSTGPHLHFEVTLPSGLKVDPEKWLQLGGRSLRR
ncbi:peptidoglycan DD-metalloendopeptidase family protein [Rhodococcus opacus]|uniref:peptidoglycan DD-metalloendopeptidase family protein n=1 Tax=Rhodococcus opacus TaxID=37919 RepID=UPI0029C5FB82|nr:peptidoglycan DD-metalloendopeptidase family protein [Rhodococcus opacus]MDX5961849.1 peptidoglycan DD-metalloendopeptidase family protein [Rhodococcus opacus]